MCTYHSFPRGRHKRWHLAAFDRLARSYTFFLILPIIDGVGTVAKFKPWFSITFARLIAIYVIQTPYPTDQTITTTTAPQAGGGAAQTLSLAQYYPDLRLSLLVMGAYFIVALFLSVILMRRRQM